MLEGSDDPMAVVARRTGFGSPESLRRAFTRTWASPPVPTGRASAPRTALVPQPVDGAGGGAAGGAARARCGRTRPR
ncbi:hypothetical protein ABZ646_02100 [Streptomyces sp. NPDC007162]|uniref:hypothetical protein n=1 Tax=Streptomyces sp. NPDC007162 TaxID=3156917 RepID=UPI0033F4B7A9